MSHRVERVTVTVMEACAAVGVARRTIYNWILAGKIEYIRTASGKVRIFEDTLWRSAAGSKLPAASTAERFITRE